MAPLRRKFLDWLIRDPVFEGTVDDEDGKPFIHRWIVDKFGTRIFIHQYFGPDPEPWLHDHPWPAVGIPIIGGYTEERLVRLCPVAGMLTRMRRIWLFRPNVIPVGTFHKIHSVKPGTWTIFWHGKRSGAFGFLKTEWKDDRFETRYFQPKDNVLEYSKKLMGSS